MSGAVGVNGWDLNRADSRPHLEDDCVGDKLGWYLWGKHFRQKEEPVVRF